MLIRRHVVAAALSAVGALACVPTTAGPAAADSQPVPICFEQGESGNHYHIFRNSEGEFTFRDANNNLVSADVALVDNGDHDVALSDDPGARDHAFDGFALDKLVPGDCGMAITWVTNTGSAPGRLQLFLNPVELSGNDARFFQEFLVTAEALPLTPISALSEGTLSANEPIAEYCVDAGEKIAVPVIFDFPYTAEGGNARQVGPHSVRLSTTLTLTLDTNCGLKSAPKCQVTGKEHLLATDDSCTANQQDPPCQSNPRYLRSDVRCADGWLLRPSQPNTNNQPNATKHPNTTNQSNINNQPTTNNQFSAASPNDAVRSLNQDGTSIERTSPANSVPGSRLFLTGPSGGALLGALAAIFLALAVKRDRDAAKEASSND